MYKIIGGDQQEYGPVSADEIRNWVAEGRANAQTQVQMVGDTGWRPLGSYPELANVPGAIPAAGPPPLMYGASASSAALPLDILTRDYDLDLGSCISRAWKLVTENFGIVVGGSAIYVIIEFLFIGLGYIPLINILSNLVKLFITGPLLGGLYYFLLKNIRRDSPDIGDVFAGFKLRFLQLMVTYLVQALIAIVAAIPGFIIAAFGFYPLLSNQQPDFAQIMLMVAGFVVAVVPLMYLSTSWIFSLMLVIDKNMDFWKAMETSRKVVGKHWWLIFVLLIVCGLIVAISMLLCCAPFFVGLPFAMSMLVYAYEDIFGQRPKSQA